MPISIRIQPMFWLVAGLIGWLSSMSLLGTVTWMAIILISVLVHEFGHAITAKVFGQNSVINLVAFGGVTERRGPKLKAWKEFVIVLNGPLAGFLLCACAYFLLATIQEAWGALTVYALTVAVYVNFFWTIINLLPVQPLDGGKLLRITLEGIFGFKGVRFSAFSSMVLCAVFGFGFFAYGFLLPGIVFLLLTFENYRAWTSVRSMTENDQDESLWQQLGMAEFAAKAGHYEEALKILDDLSDKVSSGAIHIAARQLKAFVYFKKSLYKEGFGLIQPVLDRLSPEFRPIAHELAFMAGETDEAIQIGNRAYQDNPHYQTAVINALCHALKGEATPAVGWLKRALDDGVPNLDAILQKHEFDAIRKDPGFQALHS